MSDRRHRRSASALCVVVVLSAVVAACGTEEPEPAGNARDGASGEQTTGNPLEHTHGLGVAEDGMLLVATHNGLFRAAAGQTKVEPIGETRKDVMGFSLVSAKRFLGSGHPGPGEDLPPNLGLIESRDGGQTWKSISLLGEADFHVLRSQGERVYGYDGTQGRFMASDDGGRTWATRQSPAAMFDLALDPDDGDRLIAATEAGLFASTDAGRRWRAVDQSITGLVAWPRRDALFIVDPSAQMQMSKDEGRTFRPVGTVGGQPAAFLANGRDLYVALSDGTVNRSSDGGATWTVRAAP